MFVKSDAQIKQEIGSELWKYLKSTVVSVVRHPRHVSVLMAESDARMEEWRRSPDGQAELARIAAEKSVEDSKRTYKEPTINNIPVNTAYLGSTFGCLGLGRQLPESQGHCYGGDARGLRSGWAGKFVSVQERLEECKMLITYFVQCGEDSLKIGQSTRVGKRLSSLQTANPNNLELLLCLPSVVGFREEDIHFRFRNHRKSGEWFAYDGNLKKFVADKIRLRKSPMDLSIRPTPEDLRMANCGGG
jgi:Meiotically Up-regulated Gene 113 (MUG113) protein